MKVPCYLGKYQLFMRIGKNEAGKVYLARSTILHREVAVKVIYETTDTDQKPKNKKSGQLISESFYKAKLFHPNIVPVLEATQSHEAGYIVMEYISAGNIVRYTHPKTLLPVNTVLQIMNKCCGALDYAFRQGMIHRNIKPENLFLSSGSDIKISDFDHSVTDATVVSENEIEHYSAYCSPEKIAGQRLSHLSDIYSLGVVAYQLLTGTLPYMTNDSDTLFVGTSKYVTPPPSSYRSGIPALLDTIILRMITRNPRERFNNWTELAHKFAEIGRFYEHEKSIAETDKYNMLRSKSELSEFSDVEILRFAQVCIWIRLPAGTVFAKEHEAIQNTYILANGSIKVTQNGRLIHILKRGECFGEMCRSKCGTTHPARLQTLTESIIAEFTSEAIAGLSSSCQNMLKQKVLDSMTIQVIPESNQVLQVVC